MPHVQPGREKLGRAKSRRSFRGVIASFLVAVLFSPILIAAPATANRAIDSGQNVLAAIEAAPIVVVATVIRVTPLAHAGYQAHLEIERSLRRDPQVTESMIIAWEEPAPSLPPRMTPGRRVLVAAEGLPSASIWRLRVPEDSARAELFGLAGGGAGYLLRPSASELNLIEHYLALDAAARKGDAGLLYLTRLCAIGQPRLAKDAAIRLKKMEKLADRLTLGPATAIIDALLRPEMKALSEALLDVIETDRPDALREPLRRRIRDAGENVPPILYAALGALDGQIDPSTTMSLLSSASPETRETAAKLASGPEARGILRRLLRRDRSPAVRAAAISRLASLDGLAAISDIERAFEDPEGSVRYAAARAAARLDPDAVASLRHIANRGQAEAAQAAVAALSMMGGEARAALAALATEHSDASMRTLAGIAIGKSIGDAH